jgi:hypothetical protein
MIILISIYCKDRLITKPLSEKNLSVLPSPEDLKYKVLVRVCDLASFDLNPIIVD